MKVLVINGSYHKAGMTAALVERFIAGIGRKYPGAQISVIDLTGLDIKFCTGTSACGKPDGKPIGECVIKDGMAKILEDMVACDVLVFASPVYCLSHTALMQRFLERCLPLMQYSGLGPRPRNPVRKDKKGVVIVSTGAPSPFNSLLGITRHAVKTLSAFCRLSGCGRVCVLKAGAMETDAKAKDRFIGRVGSLAEKV